MVKNLEKKQFSTYDEQITFLEEKKDLIITDKEYARRMLLKIGYKFRKVFFNQANNYLFNSITSRSEKFPLSMLKRTKVRTVWNPYIPAAPGFMCSNPSVWSYFTFRICE